MYADNGGSKPWRRRLATEAAAARQNPRGKPVLSSYRIINIWNSLPENVVTANTIDCFKTRLDKFWNSQDVKFDYMTGLHNRSMIT